MSKKSDQSLLKNVLTIAAVLIVFVVILRAALAPLYQEVDDMERTQQLELTQSKTGGGSNGGGGYSGGGDSSGSGENVNINVGSGGFFNWALGWMWGGPGWYSGPDYGWWGANVWNGWRNWWGGGNWNNQGRVWNGGYSETINRNRSIDVDSNRNWDSRDTRAGDTDRSRDRNNDAGRRESFQESRGDNRSTEDHIRSGGGDDHGGRR